MQLANEWAIDLLQTLLSDGPESTLLYIVDNGPVYSGPVGLLWDDSSDSFEVLSLAQTLAEIGRTEEALDALLLVAEYQWSQAAAA